jgi:hypothetical protein
VKGEKNGYFLCRYYERTYIERNQEKKS